MSMARGCNALWLAFLGVPLALAFTADAQTATPPPPDEEEPGQPQDGPPAPVVPLADTTPPADDSAQSERPKHAVNLSATRWKPGKGLYFESEDELFSMETRLRVQPLVTVANAPGAPAEMGFMLRRARVQFVGHTFGEHNKFKAEFAFSPRDLQMTNDGSNTFPGESPLLSWYLELDHLSDLTVRVGQYKIPFSRQRVISSADLQMVDRSIANDEFNLDRDIGLDIRSPDLFGLDLFRYYVGVYNGEGRSAFSNGNSDLMYLARLEFLPLGIFKDYSESDLERAATPGLSIGLAYAYAPAAGGTRVNRDGAPADGGTTDFHNLVADVMFKYAGLFVLSELFWRGGERNPGAAVDEMGVPIPEEAMRDGMGWSAQAGYLLPNLDVELAGRFGQIVAADDSRLSDRNELGGAASYYIAGHSYKIQADLFQLWGDDFSDGTTQARVQMQLSY
jgi:phosphate-selective porin OprO and OprP